MLKDIIPDLPTFCTCPQMLIVYLQVKTSFTALKKAKVTWALKLENTGAYVYVLVIKIIGVFNYKKDCKVVSELCNKACSHSVGLSS